MTRGTSDENVEFGVLAVVLGDAGDVGLSESLSRLLEAEGLG